MRLVYLSIILVVFVLAGLGYVALLQKINGLNENVAVLQRHLESTQTQLAMLSTTTRSQQNAITNLQTLAQRQVALPAPAPQKTQEQILTSVVAKTAPAVVSIVVSKAVPQLQVTYVDPFGDKFGDSGIRIPVYRQKGTSLQKVGAGTGFLVSRDGYIVTNRHVVDEEEASYTVLLSSGDQRNAQVVYRDIANDMAILKIPGNYASYIPLGDSSKLSLGQSVISIGNALGEYSNSVSVGIISGLNRTIEALDQSSGEMETLRGVIQTDAAINRGNSGGPLIDLNGNVVGINVATIAGSNSIGFAIPINSVKSLIQNVLR